MLRVMTTHKYPLKIEGSPQKVAIPAGGKIVHVAMQGKSLCMWAVVNPTGEIATRRFIVAGTGHPLPSKCDYIGTVLDAPYVWHVFEV